MSHYRSIIYYTDSELPDKMAGLVRQKIQAIGLPIISSSLKPLNFGTNIPMPGPRGYKSMFEQILVCLENSPGEIIYFCEADVLYPKEHFDFVPKDDKFYYNNYFWKVFPDGTAVSWEADQVSGLVCYKKPAIKWYRTRLATFDPKNFDRKFEPLSGEGSEKFMSSVPLVDIRHGRNLTFSKKGLHHFRKKETAVNFKKSTIDNIPGWSLKVEDIYPVN